jgi:hypothetical protein
MHIYNGTLFTCLAHTQLKGNSNNNNIPDIEKFLPVSIFKMVATIPQKFNIVRFQRKLLIYFLNRLSGRFGRLITSVCTGSCKSNYHTIRTTMVPDPLCIIDQIK